MTGPQQDTAADAARAVTTPPGGWVSRLRGWLARHWVVTVLLVLAAALRGVVLAAYQPALIFPDSVRYLQYAHDFAHGNWMVDGQRQSGYSILITPAVAVGQLIVIPLVQHLAGLATAVLLYAVLVRLGVPRWLAAVATIPVLFDPLQLVLEEYILADVWTPLFLLAGLTILVWTHPARIRDAATAGLLLGLAVTFRDQELVMVVPAALYLAIGRHWKQTAALAGCFLIPVAAYLGWFRADHGKWNFTTYTGVFLYGRVVDFADCAGLALPGYERPLCPHQPPAARVADFYMWNPASPMWTFLPPPGKSRESVAQDFSLRILAHQPLDYARAVAADFGYGFSPVRGAGPERYPSDYLRFHATIKPDWQADASLAAIGFKPPRSRQTVSSFLQDYWFYVPGPVLGVALLIGIGGAVARRRNGPAVLFTASAITALLPPALFATFDWRYQLPQLTLIPVAALLSCQALRPAGPRARLRNVSSWTTGAHT